MDRSWTMMKSSPEIAPNCPRCASTNTKFCYYNNYSLSQPRYFCKGCRRYWTKGGSLRNVPVGGGCRKSRRGRVSRLSTSSCDMISSYKSTGSDGGPNSDLLVSQDANNGSGSSRPDIDMAAVFAKYLNNQSFETTESGEKEFESREDDPFFELASSLGSNNEGESFLIDCDHQDGWELLGPEMAAQEFKMGDENFEASYNGNFSIDEFLTDQVPGQEAMWRDYEDGSGMTADSLCQPMAHQSAELFDLPFSGNYNQMMGSGSDSGSALTDNWNVGDVASCEVFSRP